MLDSHLASRTATARGRTKILINDRIADSIFQQIIIRPDDYSILATTNLNGDYISDAAAAQVGGLGIAPGANIGDGYAVFEATHGTAPKYADKDVINPGSVILSGVMMLDFIGWKEAAKLIEDAMEKTIQQKFVTYDFERQTAGCHQGGDERVCHAHHRKHVKAVRSSSRVLRALIRVITVNSNCEL